MIQSAYISDIGKVRQINEDRIRVCQLNNGYTLAIVADGMGGHKGGDIASQMATDIIQESLQLVGGEQDDEELTTAIRAAIYQANENVYHKAKLEEKYAGMGTTVVVVMANEEQIVIGHIGDSRAYLFDGIRFEQMTEDHTLVNELMKSGQISAIEAMQHPRRNVLTRALGTEQHVEVDVIQTYWNERDTLLICTDGLSSLVPPAQIMKTLRSEQTLDIKAEQLVAQALEYGGDDNISVVLIGNEHGAYKVEEG